MTSGVAFTDGQMARFWGRVDKTGDCWLWTGGLSVGGYGTFRCARKNFAAHRISFMTCVGPVPEGLDLDHLCRVRRCVNPAHLEAVTRAENLRRSPLTTSGRSLCVRGHEFDMTVRIGGKNYRRCGTCVAMRKRGTCSRCGRAVAVIAAHSRVCERVIRRAAVVEQVRQLHKRTGAPQDEIATLLGINQSTVSRALRGRSRRKPTPEPLTPHQEQLRAESERERAVELGARD